MVMAILALLVSMGMAGLVAQRQAELWRQGRAQLEECKAALIGYAVVYGRLPRPAVSASNGEESPLPCSTDAACTGLLPWATLGLGKGDPWGKLLRYSVSPRYAGGSTGTDAIDLLATGAETKTIKTPRFSDPKVLDNLATSVPAVVFSQGPKNYGTTPDGGVIGDGSHANGDEDSNDTASQIFIAREPSDAGHTRGEFDDLMAWVSPFLLKSRLMQAGFLF